MDNTPSTPKSGAMEEESKTSSKKKYEIRFNEIERVEVNTEQSTLTIGTASRIIRIWIN